MHYDKYYNRNVCLKAVKILSFTYKCRNWYIRITIADKPRSNMYKEAFIGRELRN